MKNQAEEISALAPTHRNAYQAGFASPETIQRFQAAVTKLESISAARAEIALRSHALILHAEIHSSYIAERDTGFGLIATELQSVAHFSASAVDETARAIGKLMDGFSDPSSTQPDLAETFAAIREKVRDLHHRASEIIRATKELSPAFSPCTPSNRELCVQAIALGKLCTKLIQLNLELANSTELCLH